MENKIIGPALPPHLVSNNLPCEKDLAIISNCDSESRAIAISGASNNSDSKVCENNLDLYGPMLPPHLKKKSETSLHKVVGPTLPKDELPDSESSVVDEDDIDELVGPPLPSDNSSELSTAQQKLERRAQYLKRKMIDEDSSGSKSNVTQRESWMLELPPEKATNLGLGPRSFRKREGPDTSDRSDWTDTPADRMEKLLGVNNKSSKNEIDLLKKASLSERDKNMEKMAESCKNEKRQLSLLEMHQKDRRKKQKKEKKERGDKPPERRPFDRNIDLEAHRFDEAQKKSIFKKAQLLDTRFSSGQSKYL